MADLPNKFSRFLQELKRRKTDRVLVMYAATAFVILQLADILQGGLSLPEWIMTLIIIIIATGFPVAAIFSWFFDITPDGIEKTRRLNGKKRDKLEVQLKKWKETTMISLIVIIALIIFNIVRGNLQSSEIRNTEKSIAVLPFQNLTPNEILPFKTETITAIITSGLYEIKVLDVCSKWQVLEYYRKDIPVTEIAKKLKVFFIITGELINIKDQVLLNIDLMKFSKNKVKTLWTNRYSFDPGGDIAELTDIPLDIIKELKIALSAEEKNRVGKKPSVNTAAFLNYSEGNTYQDDALNGYLYLSMGDSLFQDLSIAKSFNRALFFYDKAIKADSTFALAYARRALTRSWGYKAGHFNASDHQEKCRSDIEQALKFDKDLTEARIAYGFYYYYFMADHPKALEYFKEVSLKEPENRENNFYMAVVLRAMGEWEESQALIKKVIKHNIRNPLILTNIGLSYNMLHQYDSAIYFHEKAIMNMPRWSAPYQNKAESMILRDGNTSKAEVVIDTAISRTTGGYFKYLKIMIDLFNSHYREALLKAETAAPSDFPDEGSRYLIYAEIYHNLKNQEMAREYYKSAHEYYTEFLKQFPDNPGILGAIGISAAGLNNRKIAIEAGQKAVNLTTYDGIDKSDRERDLAQIYVMLGEYSKGIAILDELLKKPSGISIKLLQIEPVWKPLWEMPEFKKLISEYSGKEN